MKKCCSTALTFAFRLSTFAFRRGHAELAPAGLGERCDALVDLLVGEAREAQAHPAAAVVLVDRPLGPRVDRDARREGRL